ncbi:MAG TPA: class I SAM-dependent methyltransferase [Falsiroseomonas sp.]|jgi:SAM-dependent methyltransferase|nr:class I SAM-dependent methyltransferase [Falsiroseomonas sp.]
MLLLFDGVNRLRARLGPTGTQLVNRLLYEAIYSLPAVRRRAFFNSGYHPPPEDMPPAPPEAGAPVQAALYHYAIRVLTRDIVPAPQAVLDIGCGLGGGLLYAAGAFPAARLAGLDQSRAAVRAARRRLARAGVAAELRAARGDAIPFPAGSFDLVASIGTVTYVGYPAFVRAAAPMVARGGALSITGGITDTPLLWTQARLVALGRETGLELHGFEDITRNCLAAFAAQAPAHAELIARLPRFLRGAAAEWAVLPGSRRLAMYEAGRKKEFAAVFRSPA